MLTLLFPLQPANRRSKTCILVKNLPAGTDESEIKSLFEKHGHIARFLMPKHGITALVDFIEPFEAKKAFSKLAYSQFKSSPLYLEWAPENIFIKPAVKPEKVVSEPASDIEKTSPNERENVPTKQEDSDNQEKTKKNMKEDDETAVPENDTTLFVKNINFKTTEDALKTVRLLIHTLQMCEFGGTYFCPTKRMLIYIFLSKQ